MFHFSIAGMPKLAKTCKMSRLFVHPATRRMGIGTKMIEHGLEEAQRMGYNRFATSANKTNSAANKLLVQCGFSKVCEDVFASAFPLKFKVVHYEKDLSQ